MKSSKIPLIVVVGPTATGKSDLAVRIAQKIKGEVISADSRQVYRDLNIGTGKITQAEMQAIPHHLLDRADPKIPANSPRRYSVEKWRVAAEKIINEINSRGHVPIICGGTGFYIQALVDGIVLPEVAPNTSLRSTLSKKTAAELFNILVKLDKKRAHKMLTAPGGDSQNPRRLIRAIEIATALGKIPPITQRKEIASPYAPLFIGLIFPSEKLKEKIKTRLEKRLNDGMIDEARNLHKKGLSWKRMNELGLEYHFLAQYLQTSQTPADQKNMSDKLATAIWHYAKRQITWFKRDSRIHWFDPTYPNRALKLIDSHFSASGINTSKNIFRRRVRTLPKESKANKTHTHVPKTNRPSA